jgi:hypothetical protein
MMLKLIDDLTTTEFNHLIESRLVSQKNLQIKPNQYQIRQQRIKAKKMEECAADYGDKKAAVNMRRRAYVEKNKAAIYAQNKATGATYRATEKCKAVRAIWVANNKEKITEYQKQYYIKHKMQTNAVV